ncbi:MAG: hypothetical protein IBX55_07830 [Methyloprofundus sp.]|nr:hypothetical protein [Methyloprofundus sp.]
MQDYLPEIQALLSEWYLLTLNNPLYFGVLVLTVWLCLVFFYNIKVLFLKKKHKLSEQGRIELQSQLETTQQELKQSEQKLADSMQQAEQNAQAAADFVEQVKERNLAIVTAIRALAAKFDLNEQLVGADTDMKAEFIWQQQDNIVAQLTERLEAAQKANNEREAMHQQEIGQLKEKEALINSLHATLDAQTKQFAQLEQALEAQKLKQQEQQIQAQQQLASTLEKHQLDFARLLNDLKSQTSAQTQTVKDALVVEPKKPEPAVADIEQSMGKSEVLLTELTQPVAEGVTAPVSLDTEISGEPLVTEVAEVAIPVTSPSLEREDNVQASSVEPVVSAEPAREPEIVQPDVVNLIKKDAPIVDEIEFQDPNYNASSLHLGDTFKGLLGKMTLKKKANDKPVVENSEQVEKKVKKSSFKLKGLYSNLTSKGK